MRGRSVFQSAEDPDAMVEASMEYGDNEGYVNEGYERLDELVARLTPVA